MDIKKSQNELSRISLESGTIYLNLSNAFPILIDELTAASRNDEKQAAFKRLKTDLEKILSMESVLFDKKDESIENLKKNNDFLSKGFDGTVGLLDEINDNIQQIQENSHDMDIISINTMIVSVKSGKKGQAFSYITNRLKQLSAGLNHQTEEVIAYKNEVQKEIADWKQKTNRSEKNSEDFVFDTSLLKTIQAQFQQIIEEIEALFEIARSSLAPVNAAMAGIQWQDIIRQSLEHVISTLGKILPAPSKRASLDDKLDTWVLNEKLLEAAIRIISTNEENIQKSVSIFKENFEKVNEIMDDAENKKQSLVLQSEHNAGLTVSVSNFDAEITKLIVYMKNFQRVQNSFVSDLKELQEVLKRMQFSFNEFLSLISNLEYITIAQRIEVTRNEEINTVKATVDHMADIIASTNDLIEKTQQVLKVFISKNSLLINNFIHDSKKADADLLAMEIEKNNLSLKITAFCDSYKNLLSSITVFSSSFYENFMLITKSIQDLLVLKESLNAEKQVLVAYKDEVIAIKNALLQEKGVDAWEVHNQELNDFINSFTILEDKQSAGSLSGVFFENGVEAGEITLF